MVLFFSILILLLILGFIFKDKIRKETFPEEEKNLTIDQRYNAEKRKKEKEIDLLLSKMGENGINDLSAKEQKRLNELSKK